MVCSHCGVRLNVEAYLPCNQESINSYVVAVLLSEKLSAYKGTVPRDHVFVCCPARVTTKYSADLLHL